MYNKIYNNFEGGKYSEFDTYCGTFTVNIRTHYSNSLSFLKDSFRMVCITCSCCLIYLFLSYISTTQSGNTVIKLSIDATYRHEF